MRVTLRGISWDWSCIGPWSYLCDEWDVTTLHDPYMHERLRLGFERDFQLIKMRAHELNMIMRWRWVELDEVMILSCMPSLHLPPPSPISIFSLVLPCSCSFRERGRWEMREWVELVLLQQRYGSSHFVHMTCGVKGWVKDSSLPTYCMQFRHWWMVRCDFGLPSILCRLRDGSKHLGFGIGPINFIPKVNNLISNNLSCCVTSFRSWVTSLGRKRYICDFYCFQKLIGLV
jgi:hypothetical protein